MSLFSSIGHFLENPIQPITHAIGKTVGVTANLNNGVHIDPKKLALTAGALAIPGVGSALEGGLGALGGALGSIPGAGAVGGALGSLGSAAQAIPGVSSIEGLLKSGGSTLMNDITGAGSGGASGSPGLLSSIESFLTGNGGKNALGIAQGVNSALLQKKASDYANNAMGAVNDSYNSRAPLRVQGIAGLLDPQAPSLAGVNATRTTGSPYAGVV